MFHFEWTELSICIIYGSAVLVYSSHLSSSLRRRRELLYEDEKISGSLFSDLYFIQMKLSWSATAVQWQCEPCQWLQSCIEEKPYKMHTRDNSLKWEQSWRKVKTQEREASITHANSVESFECIWIDCVYSLAGCLCVRMRCVYIWPMQGCGENILCGNCMPWQAVFRFSRFES